MTPAPAPISSPAHSLQNSPSSSTSDPQNTHPHDSSDNNDDDSETEDEALKKEISHLREKCVTDLLFHKNSPLG